MDFQGFTPETGEYLWDLAFHNERPWFQANKERFLRVLKEPFDAMARSTLLEMERRHPDEIFQLHISRIYRDARRLYGRPPYNDHLWFTIWTGADKHDNPAFWFEFSKSDYGYGTGLYEADSAHMAEYREYIAEHPEEVGALARKFNAQKTFRLDGEDFKRPKGHVSELLDPWYNKRWVGIGARFDLEGDAFSPDLPRIVADAFDFMMPYYRFFRKFGTVEKENYQ
jgi:uncharacterized protein (TIGR02453 family)